jgi:AraC-like DNA-binding protein
MTKRDATSKLPQRLTREDLEGILKAKGWSIINVAQFLGVSRQYLYTQFDDPLRARLLECAIQGLPQCTAAIATGLKEERSATKAQKPSKPFPPPIEQNPVTEASVQLGGRFEIGDGVTADRAVGSILEEGEEGWVVRKYLDDDRQLIYEIDFTHIGCETFPESVANVFFVQNGKTKALK